MFSHDSRRGFENPVHKRQTCHVPGMAMAHVIPGVDVREGTERRSKLTFPMHMQGRVNLSQGSPQVEKVEW